MSVSSGIALELSTVLQQHYLESTYLKSCNNVGHLIRIIIIVELKATAKLDGPKAHHSVHALGIGNRVLLFAQFTRHSGNRHPTNPSPH